MDRDQILANLMRRQIDDETYDRITGSFPISPTCPTCNGREKYTLDFKTYDCDCELQRVLQRHYFKANIGREYHDICLKDFEGDDRDDIVPVIQDYIDHFDDNFHYGLGITLTGPYGTGKSFAAICILKELIKLGRNVYFITFEELINIWGQSYHNKDSMTLLEKRLKQAEVLGLDELRTDKRNEGGFLAHGLDAVVRHRTSNLLPTLITTNMKRDQELDEFGKVFSLLSARNTRLTTNGHDRRMYEVRNRILELRLRGERRPIC